MSPLFAALRARSIEPVEGHADSATCTLADLAPGASAVVLHVGDVRDPATARRLVDLGFAPGARCASCGARRWPTL